MRIVCFLFMLMGAILMFAANPMMTFGLVAFCAGLSGMNDLREEP